MVVYSTVSAILGLVAIGYAAFFTEGKKRFRAVSIISVFMIIKLIVILVVFSQSVRSRNSALLKIDEIESYAELNACFDEV